LLFPRRYAIIYVIRFSKVDSANKAEESPTRKETKTNRQDSLEKSCQSKQKYNKIIDIN
jgi:hypothetical protein